MGEGIAHIISPSSAVWCGWTMLVLLVCGIMSEVFQPGIISQAKNSLLTQTDRIYKDAPNNLLGQFLISVFRIGVLAMAVYLSCTLTIPFSFVRYGVIIGIVTGVLAVKRIANRCVDYTFRLSQRFGAFKEHYRNMVTLWTIVLYPVLLVLLRYGQMTVNRWVLGMTLLVFVSVMCYRLFRQFVTCPRAILYLFIYSCTMEVLPWALMYILSNKTISLI